MRLNLALVLVVYARECTTRRDVAEMWAGLSQVRAARADEQEEEELVRKRLWKLVNNHTFFQHPDLIRVLRVHENVMAVMMNTLGRRAQAQSDATPNQPAAEEKVGPHIQGVPKTDTSHEMVVACCRFLCYFCRTGRQNQKAMFDHFDFLLENSNILLSRPSLRGSTPLDVAYSSLMENTELALALREHYLEKIAVYLSRCGLQSNSELVEKGYPDLGWDPVEGERYLDFLRFCVWYLRLQSNSELVEKGYPDLGWDPVEGERYLDFLRFCVWYLRLQSNSELVEKGYPDLGWDPGEGERYLDFLRFCVWSNSELVEKGYPDLGWDPVEGERYLDFLRFCVWVNGESVEENANLVIRLLIRRPECLGPALRGEGEGLLKAIVDANKMSEKIADRRKLHEEVGQEDVAFSHPLPESDEDEDYIDTGAAILNFYCTLVDLLGRCAPDASVIALGKNESLRARAILRSLVPLEDLQGVLSLRFTLNNPAMGEERPKSDMPSGLIPGHKQSIVLFLERVYGIETQELFYRLLEEAFLPDLRAATMLDRQSIVLFLERVYGIETQELFYRLLEEAFLPDLRAATMLHRHITMATAQDILNKQIGIEKVLGTWIEDYERRLKASSTPENKSNLESLTKDFEAFKKSVLDIFCLLQDQIVGLMQQVDELDCHSRRKVLLFSGIAEDANESLPAVISNIAVAKMGITDFQESAMQQCIRLGAPNSKRPRPVLVRLASLSTKAAIWSNKKRLKTSSVVVSEFLTRTRQELYSRTRKHFGIRACWTANGAVYLKLPDDSRVKIVSAAQLDELCRKHPAAAPTTTTAARTPSDKAVAKPSKPATSAGAPVTRSKATVSKDKR
ncbi:unnamed protein product [Plutella xylostella]|uniref:(diamondback moth) hypothetical protein n=1 Tax=Plutella xylostella TaxID=51655 RepID=A0A8S4EL23_PLUXY|nr:unnamed protein product [Plutella xylostella]